MACPPEGRQFPGWSSCLPRRLAGRGAAALQRVAFQSAREAQWALEAERLEAATLWFLTALNEDDDTGSEEMNCDNCAPTETGALRLNRRRWRATVLRRQR